jgi:hypothetical protein
LIDDYLSFAISVGIKFLCMKWCLLGHLFADNSGDILTPQFLYLDWTVRFDYEIFDPAILTLEFYVSLW